MGSRDEARSSLLQLLELLFRICSADPDQQNEVEGILISAMPTANSAQPKLPKEKLPHEVIKMVRKIRNDRANPIRD
jgi:hypothetical protein